MLCKNVDEDLLLSYKQFKFAINEDKDRVYWNTLERESTRKILRTVTNDDLLYKLLLISDPYTCITK